MEERRLLIEKSHKRSESYGVEKSSSHSKKILVGENLEGVLTKHKELIEVSIPYIDMVFSAVQDKDFIIVLTDNEGCILYIRGEKEITNELNKLNVKVGAYMNEQNIGTNAMGTAIKEDKCVQITAKEHYIEIFQNLTCSAAPIHNSKGEIIGTLNLTGNCSLKHPHTLGLVIFGVKAIENELDKRKINGILNQTYNYMESVIDNVDKGIIIVDVEGKIVNINKVASNVLNKDKEDLINENIAHIVSDLGNILEQLEEDDKIIIKEIKFKHTSKYKTKFTFKGIRHKGKVIGVVVTMSKEKEEEDVNDATGAFFTFNDIIGESAAITNVITNSKIISNSPSTVLIEGESGTGKEVLAQSMHNYSLRRKNKFVAINCGAIPVNIIESELFGYEDGTFTGGKKGGKPGKFEVANGGTLFLDEIGEMPLDMQVNLLRVLQEGRVTRLGGSDEIPIDVRVIAATNKNLKKEVKKGRFREDLYYRLCVIPIKLPPLRERKGDLEKLIEYFLRVKSFKLNKEMPDINKELYNSLLSYNWPGNIRQLENYIENIVNLDGNLSFDLWEDNDERKEKTEEIIYHKEIVNEKSNKDIEKSLNLSTLEKDTIEKAIKIYNHNMTKIAKVLGISRNTLYLKAKKYDIKL
ncbi:sigma-54-dependent Fis family transcriptional regulator [Clostridium septicum]|uniref:Sigma 54-interacting transcriptional regulator n=1 Tax=Clostridium septicum TaxID=1504 RepID=A0A9N7JJB4_CLOSE|nr:sigma 54-interacting transcriptional regulator [Clostridium septicum]AYE33659.1 sigma-54-dependent Fis family transcriptional regulator [Clostridium septicum]QAS61821.1 PAS domain-containing protein [Clostridium septicum]UEC21729.1 sigma 54-interacting transcriptional regulator [Clostridium septicum]USS00219.1 sigma 54-interacting transcriptional regulator [Clostridium septicum]WLF68773.1 sigma 54-interacting transcriptional regulator [Clostridium septicum]